MLSVLILAGSGDEERLALTLASLVPAVVEGLLREVIVVAAESAGGPAAVAEHAGCGIAADIPAAIRAARADWLLFLEAGARLREGWGESVLEHVAAKGGAAQFTRDASVGQRVLAFLMRDSGPFSAGLLISRRDAAGVMKHEPAGMRTIQTRRLSARVSQPRRGD